MLCGFVLCPGNALEFCVALLVLGAFWLGRTAQQPLLCGCVHLHTLVLLLVASYRAVVFEQP